MQRVHLQGGFGEKGRTSVGIDDGHTFLMLDAGIWIGADRGEYHPRLARPAAEIDALVVTHAHEDHIGALCWMLSQGYRGQFFMTRSTLNEMQTTLNEYALPEHLKSHPVPADRIEIFGPGDTWKVGHQRVASGHSGHVAGGVWLSATSGGRRTLYCGDVQPNSEIFPFSPMPVADLALLDCSYGADAILTAERARHIVDWIAAHPEGCVLPSPLSGRSIEILNILEGDFAIAEGMEDPLRAQLQTAFLLRSGVADTLTRKLDAAQVWTIGADLPSCPLIVHDGMGVAGPAAVAVRLAEAACHPVLLTGHLPEGSPAYRLSAEGKADWLRFPSHPVLPQNLAIWEHVGRPPVLGHSCNGATLLELKSRIPALDATARTGETVLNGDLS